MTNHAPELNWSIPRPGDILAGKYVIEGTCGRGGLAVVLSARHRVLDQRVAIKMLLPEWAGDPEVVERFLREGRAATRIRSEHVVRVFDVASFESGAPYLVLEYLEGHDLDEVLALWGPLPVPTAVDWVLQAAEAIAEAHADGIVHRDLKPGNLFLTHRADGSACIKVIDFGLSKLTDPHMHGADAKLTRPNDVMGSPHYMAPEQLRATCDADARADLWALGAVLHELIAGQPPFRGDSMLELCATVLTQPAPPLSSIRLGVPPGVEEAVLRCLEKDPAVRFANAAELARAIAPFGTLVAQGSCARIERVLEGRASGVPPPDSRPQPAREMPMEGDAWPYDAYLPLRGAVSARIILGSLLMLGGICVGAFMWMYHSVHADDPTIGVAEPQGTTAGSPPAPPTREHTPAPMHASAHDLAPEPARAPRARPIAPPHRRFVAPRHHAAAHAAAPAEVPSSASPPAPPEPDPPPVPKQAPPSDDDLFDGRK